MDRRKFLTGLSSVAAGTEMLARPATAQIYSKATRGLPPLRITNVKVILTNPPASANGLTSFISRLVITKVETSEPGLYGVGCASFGFRAAAVAEMIEKYLKPFVLGKDPALIQDLYRSMSVSSLWRTGPVENYAVSGIDMALWDIQGKRANMPVYQLLGGKTRSAVQVFAGGGGKDGEETADSVQRALDNGYKHVRIDYFPSDLAPNAAIRGMPMGMLRGARMFIDPQESERNIPKIWEYVRKKCGDKVELIQHLHGELPPVTTISLVKRLEPYRPFFFEDPFYPEDVGYMRNLRAQTTVPIAIGEKFVNELEYVGLITDRLFDFIRIHGPAIGGLTKSWKLATLGEWFGVRIAWHAPPDLSPIGHAANAHLDLAALNFGIQEGAVIHGEQIREVFPGTPTIRRGFLHINERPGLGIDIDEKQAAKYPCDLRDGSFGPRRSTNGSLVGN